MPGSEFIPGKSNFAWPPGIPAICLSCLRALCTSQPELPSTNTSISVWLLLPVTTRSVLTVPLQSPSALTVPISPTLLPGLSFLQSSFPTNMLHFCHSSNPHPLGTSQKLLPLPGYALPLPAWLFQLCLMKHCCLMHWLSLPPTCCSHTAACQP